jgi:thioredoxin-dependent peroxiredoxin
LQGQALRDRASRFADLDCAVLGASFDTVEENRAFADAQGFDYPLLSDIDQSAGAAYDVLRPSGNRYAAFPLRHSYLIDPLGVIRRAYDVVEVDAHADRVLSDLAELQQ